MSAEAWDLLVRRLEERASEEPRGYRIRVALLAALGYAYLGAVVAVLVGACVAVIALVVNGHPLAAKLLLPLGGLAFVIARALPVRIDPPQGHELAREDAPELFDEIERLRKEVGAPKVSHVLVDGDLNASVCRIPRFGLGGPGRTYLLLGLPLLQVLSPAEFRAVLAHELGHLSGRHGHFAARVYRVRETWTRLFVTIEREGRWGAWLFRRFFRWYAPYFNAYSFVLAREHEHAADRFAADAAGPEAAATALARLELAARHYGRGYWPGVYDRVQHEAAPSARPYAAFAESFWPALDADVRDRYAAEALAETTGTADTHPAFGARLGFLGADPTSALARAAAPPAPTAAEAYLAGPAAALAAELDSQWRRVVDPEWREAHREAVTARARLDELDASTTARDAETLLEHALLVERFNGLDEALPRFEAVLAVDPGGAVANYNVGRALLDRDDDRGLAHLERAMGADPEAILPGCELAVAYLQRHGRAAEAESFVRRAGDRIDVLDQAHDERETVTFREELREPDLPDDVLADLARQLGRYEDVKQAWIARRVLSHLDDERPAYLLVVDVRQRSFRLGSADPAQLVRELAGELELPIDVSAVEAGDAGALKRKIRKLEHSAVPL